MSKIISRLRPQSAPRPTVIIPDEQAAESARILAERVALIGA